MEEACTLKMPYQLRQLFCTICVFSFPLKPYNLFFKFRHYLVEDFLQQNNSLKFAINKCLIEFQNFFKIHKYECESFGLTNPIYYSETAEVVYNVSIIEIIY